MYIYISMKLDLFKIYSTRNPLISTSSPTSPRKDPAVLVRSPETAVAERLQGNGVHTTYGRYNPADLLQNRPDHCATAPAASVFARSACGAARQDFRVRRLQESRSDPSSVEANESSVQPRAELNLPEVAEPDNGTLPERQGEDAAPVSGTSKV